MAGSQRRKGAAYEREVAQALSAWSGLDIRRHLGQARDGGEDIVFGPFTVECKRRKTLKTLRAWYEQVRHAAKRRVGIPLLVMREDAGESMVVLSLTDFLTLLDRTRFQENADGTDRP